MGVIVAGCIFKLKTRFVYGFEPSVFLFRENAHHEQYIVAVRIFKLKNYIVKREKRCGSM